MKIAYITTYDPSDVHAWSGTVTFMFQALRNCGFQTEAIGNLWQKDRFFYRFKKASYASIFRKRYSREWEPGILKDYADQVEKALAKINYDVVFCPGTSPIAYLQIAKPIVFWHDATFAGKVNFLPVSVKLECPIYERGKWGNYERRDAPIIVVRDGSKIIA